MHWEMFQNGLLGKRNGFIPQEGMSRDMEVRVCAIAIAAMKGCHAWR